MAITDAILMTAVIDAEERRDVSTIDILNAFIQTPMEQSEGADKIYMKIRGPLVNMLVNLDPITYKESVMYKNGKEILYVHILKAIYGMLQLAILFYKKIH